METSKKKKKFHSPGFVKEFCVKGLELLTLIIERTWNEPGE